MQANQIPTLVPLAFAAGGAFNTIPEASQIGTNPGGASLVDGFPPLTRTPIAAGGIPPSGLDMNGVLNLITQSTRWEHAGGRYAYNAAFAGDTNVGGYPAGAMLMSADGQGAWLSLVDNNSDNPDTGPGTKWAPSQAYGFSAISGLTNTNVTLTPAQAMKSRIVLTGTLTGNVQVILPTWTREWTIVNNTIGAFAITAKTASGTGVVIPAGPARVIGDGTNIVQAAESIAPATLASHALTAGQIGAIGSQGSLPINTSAKVNGVNAANLLFNGSGEFGNAGWGSSNFGASIAFPQEGTIFINASSISSTTQDISSPIGIGPNIAICLTAEMYASGVVAGRGYIYVEAFTSAGTSLGTVAAVNATNGSSWTQYSATGTTPANTAYILVHKVADTSPNMSANGLGFRRIKVEKGSSPSLYSQEASNATLGGGTPVVGSARNLSMSVATASASATLTADEIIVCSALGGVAYKLANFNQTINLATVGASGMDAGTAPVSGFVALYAIYNPTTRASALLATNATSSLAPSVYGGSNMPAGYTASALVSVWPTNASSQFAVGMQDDRKIWITPPNGTEHQHAAKQSHVALDFVAGAERRKTYFGKYCRRLQFRHCVDDGASCGFRARLRRPAVERVQRSCKPGLHNSVQ
ncbi:hypothetical protein [Burkholderia cepacia]|uniref:hypothetical protein n=1 Tax=Burkholderia cepacia TaxID=292 RepID=UPI00069F18B0|nr:hypothetical protein [Burkholderia cepacia]